MTISTTIIAEDEIDYARKLCRLAAPYMEHYVETGSFGEPEPETVEAAEASSDGPVVSGVDRSPQTSWKNPAEAAPVDMSASPPKKGGRPKGSTNKPKSNGGAEPQTEAQPEALPLSEQIQIITDAAHDQPEKFKPLLVPLRDQLGVQYVSKALEKDRPVLQAFINEHGLAV